jgi:hypothetical protein
VRVESRELPEDEIPILCNEMEENAEAAPAG